MRGWIHCALISLVLSGGGVLAAGPGAAGADSAPGAAGALGAAGATRLQEAGEILGYEVGEERHYVLGPPEALERGEQAQWTTKLDRVEGSGARRTAVFTISHARSAPRSLDDPPGSGEVVIAEVNGELTVNAYGAPLHISYTSQRHVYDVGEELFQVDYRHRGNRYEKEITVQGANWDYSVDLIEHPSLDPEVPIGLFAFAPGSLECMEWMVGTRIRRRLGTGDTAPVQRLPTAAEESVPAAGAASAADRESTRIGRCNLLNTDPAFANPGLLSLAMPAVWEKRGDGELVLFAPLRPDLVRTQDNGIPLTIAPVIPTVPGVPGSNILSGSIPGLDLGAMLGGGPDGDKDYARDPTRYFTANRMTLSDRVRIEVGVRRIEALPLRISGFAGTAYVDDWGKVVRIDLEPDGPESPRRWVRLLHPSEY